MTWGDIKLTYRLTKKIYRLRSKCESTNIGFVGHQKCILFVKKKHFFCLKRVLSSTEYLVIKQKIMCMKFLHFRIRLAFLVVLVVINVSARLLNKFLVARMSRSNQNQLFLPSVCQVVQIRDILYHLQLLPHTC